MIGAAAGLALCVPDLHQLGYELIQHFLIQAVVGVVSFFDTVYQACFAQYLQVL